MKVSILPTYKPLPHKEKLHSRTKRHTPNNKKYRNTRKLSLVEYHPSSRPQRSLRKDHLIYRYFENRVKCLEYLYKAFNKRYIFISFINICCVYQFSTQNRVLTRSCRGYRSCRLRAIGFSRNCRDFRPIFSILNNAVLGN